MSKLFSGKGNTPNALWIISDMYRTEKNREGAEMLKKLIKYGGGAVASRIIEEQKNRMPRRPALIEELSKIE